MSNEDQSSKKDLSSHLKTFNEKVRQEEIVKLEDHQRVLGMVLRHFEDNVCIIEREIMHGERKKLSLENLWDRSVEELDLSLRTLNMLGRAEIKTLGELASTSREDLKRPRNVGKKSIEEIEITLERMGLRLKETKELNSCKK